MFQNVRLFLFTAITLAAGVLVPAGFAPAFAQDIVPEANRGVPQDWSHRHVVIRDAETMKDAGGKGAVAFHRWKERLKDPRFTMAVARRTIEVQPTANKMYSGRQLAFFDRFKRQPKDSSLTRDWSVPLGSATSALTGTGVGTAGMFPAKYTWDINATPSCTNDFIVYTTATPGATSGTSARQTVTFGGSGDPSAGTWSALNGGAGFLTITNGANSIILRAQNTVSATANAGLNFYIGASSNSNSRAYWAYNLAAAINRNGQTVGVSATSSDGVVTIIANQAGTAGNSIALAVSTPLDNLFFTLGGATLTGGLNSGANGGVQPTLVAFNNLYKTSCTQSPVGLPSIYWSVNTGSGAIVETSPALSLDGTQVAFVQRTMTVAGPTASLVLLKWKSGAATVAPAEVANSAYRACSTASAPCMTKLPLGANNQNSSPYVDYANDVIYVGDAAGRLHKFTDVFNGTPAAAGGAWPVTLSAGNMLSSPVFDYTSNRVFVGSDVSEVVDPNDVYPFNYTGGIFHAVNGTTGAFVDSAQIGAQSASNASSRSKMSGIRDGAIVDSAAGRVYAFLETDLTTACGSNASSCKVVSQFPTNFAAGAAGSPQQFGRGQIAGRVQYIGQFDDAYWSSNPASPTGNLYVCGSGRDSDGVVGNVSRRPTIWRIPITNNVLGNAVALVELTSAPAIGEVGASCSPITIIKNGANEYLYNGVSAIGTATGCTGACIYMLQIANIVFDATAAATSDLPAGDTRYFNIVGTQALDGTETNRDTQISAGQAGTYKGMTITQGAATPAGNVNTYMLRKNAANTSVTCQIPAGQTQCTDTYNTVTFAQNDLVAVRVIGTGASALNNTTWRVQLSKATAAASTSVVTGLPAAGGTSGIVVDNISTQAGTSQVYYSTRERPGRAIQASQAGLN